MAKVINSRDFQRVLILKHLKNRKKLSQAQALKLYGVYRLASRIHELKKSGHKIYKKTDVHGFAHYYLSN